jgi:DNA-binding transcriptional MerR regulator
LTISSINSKLYRELKRENLMENKPNPISPLYNIGVVTRITGVPIASLHAWERRYGFPEAARTTGGHRLYSEKDIARLRWVKNQVDSGVTVSRAVVTVRALEASGRLFLPAQREVNSKPEGKSITPPNLRESLLEALKQHDLSLADQLMGNMLAFYSPEDLTLDVIGPVLSTLGEDWDHGLITVATEHLASNYLRHRLLMWMVTGPNPISSNPVVLACAPGEWHEGSLLMLGVLLRRKGWPVAYLGQNVPFRDLAEFIDDIHPPAIVLVGMCEEPARALAEWPQWIKPVDGNPIIAFGGRAFVLQPELQGTVPGIYLGASLQDGIINLVSLLERAK